MKRLLSLALLMASLSMYAQTIHQEGFVRSVGRPENKNGVRLAGAILRVAGNHNKVQSDSLGQFDLVFDGKREGRDAFTFSSIYLSGYDIPENKIYGPYAISTTVPVELVLVPQSLKHELEERVRKQIEASYQKKLECIKAEKDRLGEEYAQKLEQLAAEYERSDILVNQIVNHYASLDYATMDSYKAQLSVLIENGELERADSLIRTVDVARLEADNLVLREAAQNISSALVSNIEQLETIYRGKADVFKLKFENDSAAFYLDKMVALDTTNVDNALEAGIFIGRYCAQYNKSKNYVQMALRQSLFRYGESCLEVAYCYSLLGELCCELAQYSYASEYFQKALENGRAILGESCEFVAKIYDGMCVLYDLCGSFSRELECAKKSMEIRQSIYDNDSDVAFTASHNNLGRVFTSLGKFSQGLDSYQDALHILLSTSTDENNPDVGVMYVNMGTLYHQQGEDKEALDCYIKAFNIFTQIFDWRHPCVVGLCKNLGAALNYLGQYSMALDCLQFAMRNGIIIYGESHPIIGDILVNIGFSFYYQRDYNQALEYFDRSVKIFDEYGNEAPHYMAEAYKAIGETYYLTENNEQALKYLKSALCIGLNTYGDKHIFMGLIYADIGGVYYALGQYSKAYENLRKSVDILSHSKDDDGASHLNIDLTLKGATELIAQIEQKTK